jgi:hypothetical protein
LPPSHRFNPPNQNLRSLQSLSHPGLDHDAELAAAIKASLEEAGMDVTPGLPDASTSLSEPQFSASPPEADKSIESIVSKDEEVGVKEDEGEEKEEQVSVDELRRRRLARFG